MTGGEPGAGPSGSASPGPSAAASRRSPRWLGERGRARRRRRPGGARRDGAGRSGARRASSAAGPRRPVRTARSTARRSGGSCSRIRRALRELEALVHPAVRPRDPRADRGRGGRRRAGGRDRGDQARRGRPRDRVRRGLARHLRCGRAAGAAHRRAGTAADGRRPAGRRTGGARRAARPYATTRVDRHERHGGGDGGDRATRRSTRRPRRDLAGHERRPTGRTRPGGGRRVGSATRDGGGRPKRRPPGLSRHRSSAHDGASPDDGAARPTTGSPAGLRDLLGVAASWDGRTRGWLGGALPDGVGSAEAGSTAVGSMDGAGVIAGIGGGVGDRAVALRVRLRDRAGRSAR